MSTTYKHFEVGSKLYHEDYGEGMVVEVRPRRFFDILEVAFGDGVKRLNSNHPKISDKPWAKKAPPPAPVDTSAQTRKHRDGKRNGAKDASTLRAEESASAESATPEVPMEDECAPENSPFGFSDRDMLCLDLRSIQRVLEVKKDPEDGGNSFQHHLAAERLGLTRGFKNLLALSAVQDLDKYDFQITAVNRVLRDMRGRAILADEVGLGKTIEAGLVLKEYILRGLVRKALILTPVSLMSQWREELRHKFDIPVEVRARGQRWDSHPWFIASIDTAKTEKNRNEIAAAGFDLVIVDEAHRVRNHLTQGWKFIESLTLKYLLLLTATPVQNDLRELYNLVTLVKPGHLGTYREFRKEYMRRGDKRLPKEPAQLAQMIGHVMVRTSRSSTALTFPKREVRILEVEMTKEERKLYDGISNFVRETIHTVPDEDRARWYFLLLLLQKEMGSSSYAATRTLERAEKVFRKTPLGRRLKKLAEIGNSIKKNAKFDGLLELVREDKKEKILIFTQFRRTLEFVERELRAEGYDPVVFHGSLTPKAKDKAIEQFRGKKRILISTEAGGEGRNLQFCRTLVNYDLPWNPMRIEQRIGRIHRLGQTRDTLIWNFTARDTVEDYVLAILHKKIQMFELVIGEMDMVLGQWDRDNFEQEIFRIWTDFKNPRDRARAFDDLAEDIRLAATRYDQVKEYDDRIFTHFEMGLRPPGNEMDG